MIGQEIQLRVIIVIKHIPPTAYLNEPIRIYNDLQAVHLTFPFFNTKVRKNKTLLCSKQNCYWNLESLCHAGWKRPSSLINQLIVIDIMTMCWRIQGCPFQRNFIIVKLSKF